MGELPTGKSVGRETLMDKAQRAGRIGIRKIAVEVRNLRCQQESFVNDRARRQRRNVKEFLVLNIRFGNFFFSALAHHIQLALKRIFINLGRTADEYLLYIRLRSARNASDGIAVHWRIPPAEDAESLFPDNALEYTFAVQARMFLNRQESHAYRVLAGRRQFESENRALAGKKLVRNLNQDAGAVASFGIAAAGAAMREIYQDLDSLLDDLMALLTANAGYKTHSASVVLVRRVIETLRRRQTVFCFPKLQWIFPRGLRDYTHP